MPNLELTDQQVVELVKQLPPDHKRAALLALAQVAAARREERMEYAEAQIRRVCAGQGLDWDKMSEDEREAFIDRLVHEEVRYLDIHEDDPLDAAQLTTWMRQAAALPGWVP